MKRPGRASTTLVGVAAIASCALAFAPGAEAHGVDIEIELDPGRLELEFTDETGQTCGTISELSGADLPITVILSPVGEDADLVTVVVEAPGEEVCVLAPVDTVNEILADTDAYQATAIDRTGARVGEGVLRKPLPPGFEAVEVEDAEADDTADAIEDDGIDATRVFLIGGAVGLGIAAIRTRRR